MNDAGYTLAEALAALLMIGLASSGLIEALHWIGRNEVSTAAVRRRANDLAQVHFLLARIPSDIGPFRTTDGTPEGDFSGDTTAAAFPCGVRDICRLTVTPEVQGSALTLGVGGTQRTVLLPTLPRVGLRYLTGSHGLLLTRWPSDQADDRLLGIEVVADTHPLALLDFPSAQAPACAFDLRTNDCLPLKVGANGP